MSDLFNSMSSDLTVWWRSNFGNTFLGSGGQAHSYADPNTGYRDAQDDAINELNGVKATQAVGGKDNSVSGSSWSSIGKASVLGIAKGIQAASATAAQRRQLEMQAVSYDNEARTAALNANVAKNNMYNAYTMGAWKAMQQGLYDGQVIASTRAKSAQSGVRMNTGSKAEVESSARLIKEQNRIANQMSTTSNAMNAYIQETNYRAQGIIAQGNAQAARTMQHGYSPFISGLTTFSSSLLGSLLARG